MPPEEAVDVPVDDTEISGELESPEVESPVESEVTTAPEQAAPATSPWDTFKQIPGLQGRSDEEVAASIYQALQHRQALQQQVSQFQGLVPQVSEYLSKRELFDRWQQQQAAGQAQAAPAPQPAPKPEEHSWWNPPKIRDAYKQYLVKDEQGRDTIDPNAPLDAKHALAEYQAYRADFARKFLENPEETLAPMVARVAEQRAQELLQRTMARRDEEAFVSRIETENKDWLLDESGRASREALLAQKYVEDAKRFGIQGAEPRWEFAKSMVERDLLLAYYQTTNASGTPQPQGMPAPQQQPQGDAQAKQNMEYLRQQAMRTPARSSPGTADPRVPPPNMTFAEKLQMQAQQQGLTTPLN